MTTDRIFSCPAVARHDALGKQVPTYVYEYAEPEPRSAYPDLTFEPGAVHAAELKPLFPDHGDSGALLAHRRACPTP